MREHPKIGKALHGKTETHYFHVMRNPTLIEVTH